MAKLKVMKKKANIMFYDDLCIISSEKWFLLNNNKLPLYLVAYHEVQK